MVENLKFKSHPDPATYRAMENPKIILFYFQMCYIAFNKHILAQMCHP